jgi:hypothetical protein
MLLVLPVDFSSFPWTCPSTSLLSREAADVGKDSPGNPLSPLASASAAAATASPMVFPIARSDLGLPARVILCVRCVL